MTEALPCVTVGQLVISYSNDSVNGIGLVIEIKKVENVYRRSHFIYTILWNDYPEPIDHNESSVRSWREKYLKYRQELYEQTL